jgi:two-component system sensor histidine kinase KdpD
MDEQRIDPDKLLLKIQEDESKETVGKLKIFLGAAAGVGKTYAMLKAAAQLLAEGEDIVIGYIETHTRLETKEMLPPNIEYIPLREIPYKNTVLKELDVDAIILRHPQIVIVDELAHTNVAGSRNTKRYQDILEILNAGIDVYTALNIQHLESLNDIVEQIVGTKVVETVPDQVLEMADEVVLIDLPSEELLERLNEGKIYPQERIEASLKNFFRKGNLTALRELALRKTAQKVDQQVLEYRQDKFIDNVWASGDKLLLVLEPGYSTEKIIRSSKNIYDKGFGSWFVGYPELEGESVRERQRIIDLVELAKQLGAEPIHLVGADPAIAIATAVEEQNINTIVLAQYKLPFYYRLFGKSLVEKLQELVPNVGLHLITDESSLNIPEKRYIEKEKYKLNYTKVAKKLLFFFLVFSIFGFIMHFMVPLLDNENIIMLYLLLIIISNRSRGMLSSFIAAIMASLSYDFFITPPYFIFIPNRIDFIITPIVITIVGVTFNVINGNLRYQVSKLRKWQRRNEWLNGISENFSIAMVNNQLLNSIPVSFTRVFAIRFMLLLPNEEEELELKAGEQLSGFDPIIANWVYTNNTRAGLNTDTFALSPLMYVPVAHEKTMAVIVVKPNQDSEFFLPDIQSVFDSFIRNLAISLERIYLMQLAIRTKVALAQQK